MICLLKVALGSLLHGDGPKHYSNTYNCAKCSKPITMTYERSKADSAYWE